MGKKKNFVLDTNVILHDYKCLNNFQENDIYLPIVVLEELDHFKKGNDQINYNAREFVRELDLITGNELFSKGASLGEGRGRLYVVTSDEYHDSVAKAFHERTNDHQILSMTLNLIAKHPATPTILVTKDINLRLKARSLGIPVEDYITDKVINTDIFEKEHETFEGVDPALIDLVFSSKDGIELDKLDFASKLEPNQCFVLKSDRNSVPVRYNPYVRRIMKVTKEPNFGIMARNVEQSFALDVLNDDNIKLVGMTGKAGTGKTLLALASALKQAGKYKQILLARPIVSLGNKDIGFLPGDEKQKIAPFMQPLFDNFNVIKGQFPIGSAEWRKLEELFATNQLVIEALAFIRGRSLSDTFFIVDEAQNLTPHEIKTIITRAGENTKMVFTGDIQQIDSPYLDAQSNGLAYMIDKMKGQELFAHINLIKGERSELSELASNIL